MEYEFTRIQARVLLEFEGEPNVIRQMVIGMTGVDESSGIQDYRDTLVSLPDPDPDNFTPFEDITQEWVLPICEKAATDNNWEEVIAKAIEAKKVAPHLKPLPWQVNKND